MFKNLIRVLSGDPTRRELTRLTRLVERINELEKTFESYSDDALRDQTEVFRRRLREATSGIEDEQERYQAEQVALNEILPEAFAVVREASKRTLGLRHYDVQLMGGIVLHEGKIAEMRTGEGKTLVATLPLYLNALTGRGVHLVTVNDYLARRDARWMAPIYDLLGLKVGVLQMAARTENGKKAFIVDLEKSSPFEDQHQLRMVDRAEAYRADIVYGTNSEFGFDYLRDNLAMRLEDRVQRGHYYAIVDEVDNILIDEARTPLIISGPAAEETEWYVSMAKVVRQLREEDYEINERDRTVTLTEVGKAHVEALLDMALGDPDRPEDVTPEQARIMGYLEQALKAQFLFKRNKDYIVQGGKVIIVDEFTGRLMPGRRWSEGLHQAVEAKEGVRVEPENVTYATITIQNYFRMYQKLAGMSGTAVTEAEEFSKIYKLEVVPIPTNLEYLAMQPDSPLVEVTAKDEDGYKFTYYARRDDPLKHPVYWKRKDYPDVVYRTEEAKLRAITLEILRYHVLGRPLLVGTTSVEHSERLSQRLQPELLRRLMQVLLVRQAWLEKHNRQESETAIPELQFLNKPLPELNVGELRQFARSVGITSLNPEDAGNLERLVALLGVRDEDRPRLIRVLQGGIPHQVLNARKHDEESQIIARAGAYGAVTIATNMAGRGVDIKLGGELREEVIRDVVRVLRRNGFANAYEMSNEERRQALQGLREEHYGIYAEAVHAFLKYMDEMEKVRALGGLHVIGSERHEARRIDNQLRGRAARQGDPGSSRFYLSLEDDLMRLFGGEQVESMLRRFNFDESLPIEHGLVSRIVEQSQTRVEGMNFDVRKHLLEYDDVLNLQRKRIYAQRDRVFTKEDLSEDVTEMLRSEIQARVPAALRDAEGPWRLLAYLEEIQPPIDANGLYHPSYTLRLVLNELRQRLPEGSVSRERLIAALLEIAQQALEAEHEHLYHIVENLLERAEETFEAQLNERLESLSTFFEGLEDRLAESETPLRPQALLEELQSLVRTPLRLNPEQQRRLVAGEDGREDLESALREQIETHLQSTALNRLLGALQQRVENWSLRPADVLGLTWEDIRRRVLEALETAFDLRLNQLIGEEGQIRRDLTTALEKANGNLLIDERGLIGLLLLMMQGTRLAFDRRTHRRGQMRYLRLTYIYYAARLLADQSPQALTADILDHLETAQEVLRRIYGRFEFNRLAQTQTTVGQLHPRILERLSAEYGEDYVEALRSQPLEALEEADRENIIEILGWRLQNEIYRDLLLGVISQMWVDYLTRIEALRVSIGLEAYAQRDPLVQYKSRASEMFEELLSEIRAGVVTRMFTAQPTRSMTATTERERAEAAPIASAPASVNQSESAPARKKRRRH